MLFCLAGQASLAQPVQVTGAQQGQGYLFSEQGICYLLTAAHVTDGTTRAQILTQDGHEGMATMMRPFWPGFDVDVGQVRRLSAGDCSAGFEDLAKGAETPLAAARVVLPLVGPGGVDNPELAVIGTDYLEFTGRFSDPAEAGKKGMSGSFALLAGRPVGMARAVDDSGAVRFVQMAEIAMNLRRWLDRSANMAPAPSDPEGQGQGQGEGLPYEVVSSSPAAVDGAHLIEAMVEGSAPFVYPAGQDATILLRNLAEGQKVVTRLRIESLPDAGYSQPRYVRIDLIAQEDNPRPQFWKAEPFPPDGVFDTGALARRYAAQLRITLIGARGDAPVRIDRIVMD